MALGSILKATQSPLGSYSSAATALGLGDQLAGQVAGETDEERRRRLKLMQDRMGGSQLGNDTGSGSVFGGLAASQLFGSYGR